MGTTLLTAMETNVRNDTKDIDATNYLWTTAELDRHIAHAVNDYQRLLPLVGQIVVAVQSQVTLGPSSPITTRQQIAPPPGYLWAMRVEYPIDQEPPAYLVFREEVPGQGSLFFPVAQPPRVGDYLKIWYAQAHVLTTAESTINTEHEELIVLGAVAYAAQAATRYAQNRLNASAWTPKGIAEFAKDRMAAYQEWLEQIRSSYGSAGVPFPQWGDYPTNWTRL